MCCCGQPNVNGTSGAYSWDGHSFSTRPVNPPDLGETDKLLYDEPGRCGGIDSHSHHFRLVRSGSYRCLLVRHGGGDERMALGCASGQINLDALDSDGRYWLFHTLYAARRDAAEWARETTTAHWRKAAAEKRIRTRKVRAGVKVWIEQPDPSS